MILTDLITSHHISIDDDDRNAEELLTLQTLPKAFKARGSFRDSASNRSGKEGKQGAAVLADHHERNGASDDEEQELESSGSAKSVTVDDEEVGRLDIVGIGFPIVRVGQQLDSPDQGISIRDKYYRAFNSRKGDKSRNGAVVQAVPYKNAVQ